MKKLARPRHLLPFVHPVAVTAIESTREPVSVAALVADAFGRLNVAARARMLGRLLAAVGSLALAVVGGGAFAKYNVHKGAAEIPVTREDAARATATQVYELVRYVQQSNTLLFERLIDDIARLCGGFAAPQPRLV
jgi:hypothetical protein